MINSTIFEKLLRQLISNTSILLMTYKIIDSLKQQMNNKQQSIKQQMNNKQQSIKQQINNKKQQLVNKSELMNCHYLLYKSFRTETPYESYIKRKKQAEETKDRIKFYDQILKFRQNRYPRELMLQLEKEINPFELSIDKLKEFYNSKFPQYSNELVHEAVQFVFKRKCQQSEMVKESSMIIEYGNEHIRNGRKLQKEDFTFHYSKLGFDGTNNSSQDKSKQENSLFRQDTDKDTHKNTVERPYQTDRNQKDKSRNQSPSKLYEIMMQKTQRFNDMLMQEIKRERNRFENIKLIEEGDPDDILNFDNPTSRRQNFNDSFPKFRETDLIIQPEGFDTGRSDLEQLNFLLSGMNIIKEDEEPGEVTGRSRGSSYQMKINKDVMDNLYNARGKLKIDLVRRVVDKIRKDRNL